MAEKILTVHFYRGGELEKKISLADGQRLIVGREEGKVDLRLDDNRVSRKHAGFLAQNGQAFIADLGSKNGTHLDGKPLPVNQRVPIKHGSEIRFGQSGHYVAKVEMVQDDRTSVQGDLGQSSSDVQPGSLQGLFAQGKTSVEIGRDENADLTLDSLVVSRRHAKIEKQGDSYLVVDLGSRNGTYLNGKRLNPNQGAAFTNADSLRIGPFDLKLSDAVKDKRRQAGEIAILADHIGKTYPNGYVGLHGMTVSIPRQEFVALMGPSGCGKSTLLKCLNGDNPPTQGAVYIDGLELVENYDFLKRSIGYVPQDDIVHRELSVDRSLYYAAKLKLATDVSEEEIKQRIDEVLTSLNINDPKIRKNKVGSLSGGQRKRVSIAVELLSEPTILFLDEPTSPLDPETIEEFLKCIQQLARDKKTNTTIVMVTHKPEDLNYVDTVIFLSSGGYLTYYGDKDNMLSHFSKRDITQVYSLMSKKDTGRDWYERWQDAHQSSGAAPQAKEINKQNRESLIRQFFWLSMRYANIKFNDWGNMTLLLAQPIIIAGLVSIIFNELQVGVLFMMAMSSIWFGVSNAAKEIVGEIPIYKRERMFNMSIGTYLLSKLTVLSVIAMMQVLIYVCIIHFKYMGQEHELSNFNTYLWFMFYLAVSATLLGLLLSAVFTNTEKVMTVVPIALMPQILLAGVITRIDHEVKELLSYLTLGRWGTEGFARIQDNGGTSVKNYIYEVSMDSVAPAPGMPPGTPYTPVRKAEIIDSTESFHSISKVVPQRVEDRFVSSDPKAEAQDLSAPYMSGTKPESDNALEVLGYYPDCAKTPSETCFDALALFDSYNENLLAISILNLVIFAALFVALKRKDSI